MGVGTALKVRAVYAADGHVVMVGLTPGGGQILFAEEREDGVPDITLSKNEVVAMVNALHQLSRSVFDVQVRTLGQQCHPLLFVTTPPCVVAQTCTAYARPRSSASHSAIGGLRGRRGMCGCAPCSLWLRLPTSDARLSCPAAAGGVRCCLLRKKAKTAQPSRAPAAFESTCRVDNAETRKQQGQTQNFRTTHLRAAWYAPRPRG